MSQEERNTRSAMLRGWRRKCPNCGKTRFMYRYLKVHDSCPNCGEELYHHRADDGPAYFTISIVAHIVIPVLGWVFIKYRPDPLMMIIVFGIWATALTLYILPRIKGLMIGFQWAKRMHGFDTR